MSSPSRPSIYGQPDDNRNQPPAKPVRDGKRLRCPGCRGLLSNHTPAACPDCRQPIDREVSQ